MGRSSQAPNARDDLPQRIQFTTSVGTYIITIIYNQMNPDVQYPKSKIKLILRDKPTQQNNNRKPLQTQKTVQNRIQILSKFFDKQ